VGKTGYEGNAMLRRQMPKGTMKVTVLGAGSWGTTVASLVAGKNDATVWGRDEAQMAEIRDQHKNSKYLADYDLPENLHGTADLEEAVAGAHVLVVGVPSHAFRATLEAAKPFVHPWIPIISLTKGLEAESMLRMTEVIKDVLPGRPVAALSGPNLAKEIMAGQAAASVVQRTTLKSLQPCRPSSRADCFACTSIMMSSASRWAVRSRTSSPSLLAWPKGSASETTLAPP